MLLLIEPSGVQTVSNSKERKPNIRQEPLGGLANGEGQELDDRGPEGDARLADHEQLVDEGDEDHEAQADDPHPNGAHGHRWIIVRVDDGSDLGVRAVAREEGDLDLCLENGTGVLIWLLKVVCVADEIFEMFQGGWRKVRVGSVGVNQLLGEL